MTEPLLTKDDVLKAYRVLKTVVNQTPLQRDNYLSEKYNANIYLKREDLQMVRSFKIRGAYYAMTQLEQEVLDRGVVCASAGNHAQGVAYTAFQLKCMAHIFMPVTTPNQKISQVKYFGGEFVKVHLVGDNFDECSQRAHEYGAENELHFIEPFDDLDVIAGQGSLAVEIHQDLVAEGVNPDIILAPVGGGGLISGVSSYIRQVMPEVKIIGVESVGAPSMKESLDKGEIIKLDEMDTFSDGTAVARVGELTYQIVKQNVNDIVTVEEGLACSKILDMYTRQAIIVEPSGALSVAALDKLGDISGKTIVCVISGGNNDINRLAEIEERAQIYEGRRHYFVVNFPQRAGALREFVTDILGPGDDITVFQYTKKSNQNSGPLVVGVDLGKLENLEGLLARLSEFDPSYISINENSTLFNLLV